MSGPTLGRVLEAAAEVLVPARGSLTEAALSARVTGLEFYSGSGTEDFSGKIVLVATSPPTVDALTRVLEECRQAAAVIMGGGLGASTPTHAHPDRAGALDATSSLPPVLRRVPATSIEALLGVLLGVIVGAPSIEAQPSADLRDLGQDGALALRRQEAALLVLLEGTGDAATPATLLGLRPDRDHVVVAAAVAPGHLEAYRLALRAEFPAERSVNSEGVMYTVVPVDAKTDAVGVTAADITARLRARLERAIRSGDDLPVGVGTIVPGVFALHESAASARETLRALKFRLGVPWQSGHPRVRVAAAQDLPDAIALIRAGDALRTHGDSLAEPLMRIAAYDRDHSSELLASVLVALEYRGNLTMAASVLGIHPNSLRARLARVKEVSGVDLDEPVSAMRAILAFLASPDAHHAARSPASSAE